jgi:hypothetical protein
MAGSYKLASCSDKGVGCTNHSAAVVIDVHGYARIPGTSIRFHWFTMPNLMNCTEAVQVTKTNDRPDLSLEGAPDIEKNKQ